MTGNALKQESAAAEDAGTQRLLKSHADGHLRSGAEKSVAMHEVLLTGTYLNRHDVSRDLGRERNLARILHGPILGHENAPPARHTPENAEQSTTAAHLSVRGHLDGSRHPRELPALRE